MLRKSEFMSSVKLKASVEKQRGEPPVRCDELLACPFCGGDAESDLMRGFIDYRGNRASATAIYCTKCNADMCMCHGDFPGYAPEDLLTILRDAWNTRQANSDSTTGKR